VADPDGMGVCIPTSQSWYKTRGTAIAVGLARRVLILPVRKINHLNLDSVIPFQRNITHANRSSRFRVTALEIKRHRLVTSGWCRNIAYQSTIFMVVHTIEHCAIK